MNQRALMLEPSPVKLPVNPLTAALVATCLKCGGTEHVDHELTAWLHNGNSIRRDCTRCGWTLGFPVWHGEKVEVAR